MWIRACVSGRAHHLPYGFRARICAQDIYLCCECRRAFAQCVRVIPLTPLMCSTPRCRNICARDVSHPRCAQPCPHVHGANGSNRCDAHTPRCDAIVVVMTRRRGSEVHFSYFSLQVLILSLTNSLCRTFAPQPTNHQLRQTLPSQNPSCTKLRDR